MKLTLIIDSQSHRIDSTDPDLLGRWIMEIFGRIPEIHPSTVIEFQAEPSWFPTGDPAQPWGPDWIADSRVISQVRPVRSPRQLVAALAMQLDELEALHG